MRRPKSPRRLRKRGRKSWKKRKHRPGHRAATGPICSVTLVDWSDDEDVEVRTGPRRRMRRAADNCGRRYSAHRDADRPTTVRTGGDRGAEPILHVAHLIARTGREDSGEIRA